MAVDRSTRYDVVIVEDLLEVHNPALLEAGWAASDITTRALVVIDATVNRLYGRQLGHYLTERGIEHRVLPLDICERSKTMDVVFSVVDGLEEFRIDRRREPIIAIGGGVLLDIVGLAAGLYRRGTPYIRVPTTLIGLVDAGVGSKTGVNHGSHKNRLGSYYPPRAVLLDRGFLGTLDTRNIANGMAEILKIALVKDERLFELLEAHGRLLINERLQGGTEVGDRAATTVIERSVVAMLDELRPNLWEDDLDRIVDFGHSVSPTIEMLALPQLLHGEAVALDMALFTVVASRRGLISCQQRDRILSVQQGLGLPISHPLLEPKVLHRALGDAVKHRAGRQRMPLPIRPGSARFFNDITEYELVVAAKELRERDASYA